MHPAAAKEGCSPGNPQRGPPCGGWAALHILHQQHPGCTRHRAGARSTPERSGEGRALETPLGGAAHVQPEAVHGQALLWGCGWALEIIKVTRTEGEKLSPKPSVIPMFTPRLEWPELPGRLPVWPVGDSWDCSPRTELRTRLYSLEGQWDGAHVS